MKEKRKFKDVFTEDGINLILNIDVIVKGTNFSKGYSFTEDEKLNTVDFHKYRYLDLALEVESGQTPKLVGFYPAE